MTAEKVPTHRTYVSQGFPKTRHCGYRTLDARQKDTLTLVAGCGLRVDRQKARKVEVARASQMKCDRKTSTQGCFRLSWTLSPLIVSLSCYRPLQRITTTRKQSLIPSDDQKLQSKQWIHPDKVVLWGLSTPT